MWGFIQRYAPDASPETHPDLDAAAGFAVRYYNDFVKPAKVFRAPNDAERAALEDLLARLILENERWKNNPFGAGLNMSAPEELQSMVFAVGKDHGFEPLRDWFTALYEVLLGASQGPRFGGFIALYGVDETIALIEAGLAGKLG
jgi:lysyl-tRNA synthetase class 1